jgi:DedD protein
MSWAFWRRAEADQGLPGAMPGGAASRAELVLALRVRARRRLIGAAALLLIAVIVVPMVLDPTPRPLPDAIPIDIPSEKTPFTPRLALPPVAESPAAPAAVPAAIPADSQAATEADKSSDAAAANADNAAAIGVGATSEPAAREGATQNTGTDTADGSTSGNSGATSATDKRDRKKRAARKAEEARARAALEGKAADEGSAATASATGDSSAGGHYALQAAALSSETAARELSDRLSKAGFHPFTEKIETKDGPRFRVRVGPYGARDEAERARARLRALGVNGDLVRV